MHDKSKSAALSLHQSQLMQQLQLLQQRYLLQQAGMGQPGAPAGQSGATGSSLVQQDMKLAICSLRHVASGGLSYLLGLLAGLSTAVSSPEGDC